MKGAWRKSFAVLTAACFVLGSGTVMAANVSVDLHEVDSTEYFAVEVYTSDDPTNPNIQPTIVREDGEMVYQDHTPIDRLDVNIDSINNEYKEDPNAQQSGGPSSQQTTDPTAQQSGGPSSQQTTDPTAQQSGGPSSQQTTDPTTQQSGGPSSQQTTDPTTQQSGGPSSQQTTDPTAQQTGGPSNQQPQAGPSNSMAYSGNAGMNVSNNDASWTTAINVDVTNGITVSGTDTYSTNGIQAYSEGQGTTTVNVGGNIDVTIDTDVQNGYVNGIDATGKDGSIQMNVGDISASGNAYKANGIDARTVDTEGNVAITAGNVTASTTNTADMTTATGVGTNANGGSIAVNTNDITVSGVQDAAGIRTSTNRDAAAGTTTITTGNIEVTAENDPGSRALAQGAFINPVTGDYDITTKDINVTSTGSASGISSTVSNIENASNPDPGSVKVDTGNITVSAQGGNNSMNGMTNSATGVSVAMEGDGRTAEIHSGDINATSEGMATGLSVRTDGANTVTADVGSITADGQFAARGINIEVVDDGSAAKSSNIDILTKDITATGDMGVGMEIINTTVTDATQTIAEINIIADGTVSGDDVAIAITSDTSDRLLPDGTPAPGAGVHDTDHINLTMWQAVENQYNQIVRLNGGMSDPVAQQQAVAAIEARINYIVKIADAWKQALGITTANGNTVNIHGETFSTANENELVNVNISLLGANEALDGIYYTDGDTATLIAADQLIQNADGSYSISMRRGGAMKLSLKVHTHVAGAAARENETDTGYDEVVRCTECGAVLSSTHVDVAQTPAADPAPATDPAQDPAPATDPTPAAAPAQAPVVTMVQGTPTEVPTQTPAADPVQTPVAAVAQAAPAPAPAPAPAQSDYVPVDPNTELNSVKSADRLPIDQVFETTGQYLDDENAIVTIQNVDKLLEAAEMTRFDSLSAKDRLMVLLTILDASGTLQSSIGSLSGDAQALADDIKARIDGMSADEKAALDQIISDNFEVQKATVDGQEYDSISVELKVETNGQETMERYSFFNDNGTWKLYEIETK